MITDASDHRPVPPQEDAWTGPRPALLTLILVAAVSPMSINLFVPSMPSIAADLNTNYATVQLGLSLYLIMTAVLQLLIGPLSDLYGRRPVICGGMVLFLIGTAMCILAETTQMFLAGRVVQAASASGMVLSRAVVRDVYPREKAASAMGYMVMGMAIAPMIAPAVGGQLDVWFGWRAPFYALGAFGAAALIAALLSLPETNRYRGIAIRSQIRNYRALAKLPAFWLYAALSGLTSAGFFGYVGGGPAVATEYLDLLPSAYGLYFGSCALGYSLGNFLTGRIAERRGLERMMVDGVLISLLGPALVVVFFTVGFEHPIAFFGPLSLVGFGNGMTLPNAMTAAISLKPDSAGAASGLLGATQIGTGAIASIVAAIIVGQNPHPIPLSLFLGGCLLAGLVAAKAAIRVGEKS